MSDGSGETKTEREQREARHRLQARARKRVVTVRIVSFLAATGMGIVAVGVAVHSLDLEARIQLLLLGSWLPSGFLGVVGFLAYWVWGFLASLGATALVHILMREDREYQVAVAGLFYDDSWSSPDKPRY